MFREEIDKLKGTVAALKVKDGSAPRSFKPRSVPYVYRAKVEQKLKPLEAENIIEPVRFYKLGGANCPILKTDGSIRVCGDYRITINQAAESEKYTHYQGRRNICHAGRWKSIYQVGF